MKGKRKKEEKELVSKKSATLSRVRRLRSARLLSQLSCQGLARVQQLTSFGDQKLRHLHTSHADLAHTHRWLGCIKTKI